jgi:hypothetical protein
MVMPTVTLLELAAGAPAMSGVEEKKIKENRTPKIAT